jgi:hypothetical protein
VAIVNVKGHFSIGSMQVKNAPADGYNFLLVQLALLSGEVVDPSKGVSYRDFEPVAMTGGFCLHHIVREQHLDVRHRFSMLLSPGDVARWHTNSSVPFESGYPPLTPSIQSRTTSTWPWYMWKPCLGADDTVRGAYEPIGPAPYPDDPGFRDYYQLPYVNCALAGEYRGEAELRSISVS